MRKDYRPELIAAILVLAFIAMWFTSCMTPQKATNYLKEKGLLADTCAANYPVIPDTIYKEGELVIETTFLPGDTIYNYDTVTQTEFVQVTPPVKVITKTRIDSVIVSKIDSAKLSAANRKISLLEKQLKDTEAELYKAEDKAKDRGKTSLYSIVGNGLLLLLLGFILAKKRKA